MPVAPVVDPHKDVFPKFGVVDVKIHEGCIHDAKVVAIFLLEAEHIASLWMCTKEKCGNFLTGHC